MVGPGEAWAHGQAKVGCSSEATCSVQGTASTARSSSPSRFYRLNHRLGQVVMEVTAGAESLPYHSLWVNGEDRLFEVLAAEETLFKEVEISGLLREYRPTVGILYLPTLQILG